MDVEIKKIFTDIDFSELSDYYNNNLDELCYNINSIIREYFGEVTEVCNMDEIVEKYSHLVISNKDKENSTPSSNYLDIITNY